MKSSSLRNLEISQQKSIWSTTPSNETKLTKAFQENSLVILIFSVQGSGHFQVEICVMPCAVYGHMCQNHDTDGALLIRLSFPQGYAHMTSVVSEEESCQDWGLMGLGGAFGVEWIHKENLPFQCTQHILNPWNDNKKVQISRDGQVHVQGAAIVWHSKHFIQTFIHLSAFCLPFTHSHSTEYIRSNSRFSIVPKNTLACRQEQPGIKPHAVPLVDDPLCLLRHRHPAVVAICSSSKCSEHLMTERFANTKL